MSNDKSHFLDVEDDEKRQSRMGALLGRLSTSSSSTLARPDPVLIIGRERAPGPVEPPHELLARIKAFLPAISASNKALSELRPEDIDMEKLKVDEEEYIEMNLGLGVFEAKYPLKSGSRSTSASSDEDLSSEGSSEAGSDSESRRSSSEEEELESEYSSSSSSDDDSDSESQSGSSVDMKPVFSRPIKPLPKRVLQQAKQD